MSEAAEQKNLRMQSHPAPPSVYFNTFSDQAECRFGGDWTVNGESLGSVEASWKAFFEENPKILRVSFKVSSDLVWDSRLVAFVNGKSSVLHEKKIASVREFPEEIEKIFKLRSEKQTKREEKPATSPFTPLGAVFWGSIFLSCINFFGAWIISIFNLFLWRTQMRFKDFVLCCRDCGAAALPIVTLISFLTGLTMAFVGSVQLEKFNAKIYIADLVCLAMVREMGALMVGIIMAGRTGAAFAAEIGNMKLNEELDSLRTFAVSPMEFLVLPRTLALLVMVPMLTIYADLIGMMGGLVVGTQVMDFSVSHYIEQTQSAILGMWEVFSGLVKSLAFGLIIGLVGCYKGLHTGSNSAALGKSVTSTVVTSVTLIVVADAAFEVVFSMMNLR